MPTVFIWNNENLVRTSLKQAFHMRRRPGESTDGHASIHITDRFSPPVAVDDMDFVYASWLLDKEGAGRSRRSGSGFVSSSIFEDLCQLRVLPDHVIRFPVDRSVAELMRGRWRSILEAKTDGTAGRHRFDPLWGNSARIVAHILQAARGGNGVAVAVKIRSRALIPGVWTPLMVKRLALEYYEATTMSWKNFVGELQEHQVIQLRTACMLMGFRRRSNAHGSSEVDLDTHEGSVERRWTAFRSALMPLSDKEVRDLFLYAGRRDSGDSPQQAGYRVGDLRVEEGRHGHRTHNDMSARKMEQIVSQGLNAFGHLWRRR